MTIMIAELYDALLDGGTSEEKARKAAEAIAAYESRFSHIDTRLQVLTWMAGTNILITLGVLWKVVH